MTRHSAATTGRFFGIGSGYTRIEEDPDSPSQPMTPPTPTTPISPAGNDNPVFANVTLGQGLMLL